MEKHRPCKYGVFVSARPHHGQMFEDTSSHMDVAQVVCLVKPQHGSLAMRRCATKSADVLQLFLCIQDDARYLLFRLHHKLNKWVCVQHILHRHDVIGKVSTPAACWSLFFGLSILGIFNVLARLWSVDWVALVVNSLHFSTAHTVLYAFLTAPYATSTATPLLIVTNERLTFSNQC